MKKEIFWRIIKQAQEGNQRKILGHDYPYQDYAQAHVVVALLEKRSLKSLLQFDLRLREIMIRTRSMALKKAIKKILGAKYSDQAEAYFILGLITEGEKVYKDALKDPDTIFKYRYTSSNILFEGESIISTLRMTFRSVTEEYFEDYIDEPKFRMKYDLSYALSLSGLC